MSGGYFNYNQHFINYIAGEIEEEIRNNKIKPKWSQKYTDDTIKEFKKAIKILRKAYVYAHRIDWLLFGDDDEEDFHERLREDLEKLKC